jgi:hypothetical protein
VCCASCVETIHRPDRRVVVGGDAALHGPPRVLHPCRCDAPDPEAARMEPLEIPLAPLMAEGRVLVVCPECDYHLLAVVAEQNDREDNAPAGGAYPGGAG